MKKIKVGRLADIPPKSGKTVVVNQLEIAVFHLSSGEVYALENRCPHKNGPLAEGMISGPYVFCPLHDWKIDTTDGRVQEPDTGCVTTFSAEVEDGEIYVSVPEEYVHSAS